MNSDGILPLPMFPLSSVLFPKVGIPLHVFEPRYIRLVEDLGKLPPYFGVVLITRGSEVGGGDQRSTVGTLARATERVELSDGHWLILAVGENRIEITNWLPDDPYPVALVRHLTDDQYAISDSSIQRLEKKLRYSILLKGEVSLSGVVSPHIGLAGNVVEALWQMCAMAPISAIDQQRLLSESDLVKRCICLEALIDEAIADFEGQIRW